MEGLAQAARAREPHHQHALLQPLELEQHVLLGREVEVEARPRYARFARDSGHVGPVEADPAELGDGGLEQARPGGGDLALTAPGQGGRKGHEPFLASILTPVNSTLHMSGSSSIPPRWEGTGPDPEALWAELRGARTTDYRARQRFRLVPRGNA